VPRDLERVCLKCLAKRPAERYPSAAAFADDLARFLAHKPVVARPLGRIKRGLRWGRRNPGLVAAVIACLSLGTAGVMLLTTLWGGPKAESRVDTPAAIRPAESEEVKADDGLDRVNDGWYGFSLAVPKPWVRSAPENFRVFDTLIPRFAWASRGPSALIVVVREPGTADDPRAILDAIATAKRDELGCEVMVQEVRTVAGMRAAWLVVKGKGTGGRIDGKGNTDTVDHWVAVPRLKDVVVLLLTCPAADYEQTEKSFEQVLSSLKLSGSQTKEQRAAR
jgi:hypothetical protein